MLVVALVGAPNARSSSYSLISSDALLLLSVAADAVKDANPEGKFTASPTLKAPPMSPPRVGNLTMS